MGSAVGERMKSITVAEPVASSGWGAGLAIEERYAPMIARLEARAATAGYRRRVVAAGLLGYCVILGIVGLFAGLTLLMILMMLRLPAGIVGEAKGAMLFGGIAWVLVRALMLPPVDHPGVAVDAGDAPGLFALIDRLRAAIGGPRIDGVRITDDINAAVVQEARWLGLSDRNTLLIGWPLLCALDREEMGAVIAHEMGHFGGRHGHSAGFAYGVRRRWMQIAVGLPRGIVASVLRRFFGWYGPWFAAYSFALARRQEYEADAAAAGVVGPRMVANALVRAAIQSQRHRLVWSMIWSRSNERNDPPVSPSTIIADALTFGEDDADLLAEALAEDVALDDTHPSLAQRLAALGVADPRPEALVPATGLLLDDALDRVTRRFDAEWHDRADTEWARAFAGAEADRAEREALAQRFETGLATQEEAVRYGELVGAIEGVHAAAPIWQEVVARFPDADDARFHYGAALLACDDDAGLPMLVEVARRNPVWARDAWPQVIERCDAAGRRDEAEACRAERAAALAAAADARAAAAHIDESAVLRPLDMNLREALAARVREVAGVTRLHAAVRDLPQTPEPQIVFVFTAGNGFSGTEVLDALIEVLLPLGDLMGIEEGRRSRWLRRRMADLAGGIIV